MEKSQNQNSKRERRRYDETFKTSAVKLVQTGRTIPDVSKSLGIESQLLTRWVKQSAITPKAVTTVSDQEFANMRKYVRQLEMERDILKKALTIFSQST
jgi:transposase